ncbi:MAG: PAS domain S-box protein, partial [Waterburya sp.]
MHIDPCLQSNLIIVAPETLVSEAIALLGKNDDLPACVLIVVLKKVVGIITARDVVRLVATGVNLTTTTIETVMTQPVITLERSQCQDQALVLALLQQHAISYLPIVSEQQELLGVIDVRSLLHSSNNTSVEQQDQTSQQQAPVQFQPEQNFSQALINTVGALVAVLDRQGAIVSFNHTCEQITGYSFKEIQGQQIWDFLIPAAEKASAKAVFERLLTGQVPNQYENHWIAKDGSQHLISWSNTALFNA